MNQEDKELLLKDLSTRLPYGVIIERPELFYPQRKVTEKLVTINDLWHFNDDGIYIEYIKPYLRPLSSMTEEEARELGALHDINHILSVKVTNVYIDYIIDDGVCTKSITTLWCDELISSVECLDWLNSKHFDYRGLILKGLAIAVTEDNNPY